MEIKFSEWLPDLPDKDNPGLTVALNCIPDNNNYRGVNFPQDLSDAIDSRAQGSFVGWNNGGDATNFVGNQTKLYSLGNNNTWNDISNTGGYNTETDGRWFFTQWNDYVFATNYVEPVQVYKIGDYSTFISISSATGGSSASIIPAAKYMDMSNNFLMFANINDSIDGEVPYRVHWSALNNPLSWTQDAVTQASFIDLTGPDSIITGIVGGEYATVFQQDAIYRLTYVGSPIIFQADKVDKKNGCIAPGSIIRIGSQVAFLGRDGFYIFNGSQTIPISAGKISNYFFDDFQNNLWSRVVGGYIPNTTIIAWIYPSNNALNEIPDKVLFFNYASNSSLRWSIAQIHAEDIFSYATRSYVIDDLDALYAPNNKLADINIVWDSPIWKGGQRELALFSSENKMQTLSGSTINATFETGEFEINQGYKTFVSSILPIVNVTGEVVGRVGYRDSESQAVEYTPYQTAARNGIVSLRANGRYIRFACQTSGSFDKAYGISALSLTKSSYV